MLRTRVRCKTLLYTVKKQKVLNRRKLLVKKNIYFSKLVELQKQKSSRYETSMMEIGNTYQFDVLIIFTPLAIYLVFHVFKRLLDIILRECFQKCY